LHAVHTGSKAQLTSGVSVHASACAPALRTNARAALWWQAGGEGAGTDGKPPSFLEQLSRTLVSVQYFMKASVEGYRV
jgi:hypothetical protein